MSDDFEAGPGGFDEEMADTGMSPEFDDEPAVGEEQKLTADGGLTKKIIKAGEGYKRPEKGDEVTVHYVGTLLDGTKFDASTDRNEPFVFELGLGRVIKGWDLGVARMKKGEKAILTCRSDYAYGKQGSPPKIPADATLQFEVELLSWKSKKDITGDGGVIKTTTKEGKGYYTPADVDEVVVKYSCKVQGGDAPFLSSTAEGATFIVAAGHLCPGLLPALRTMKQGETAHVILSGQYAPQSEAVPAGSAVEMTLELAEIHRTEEVTEDKGVMKKSLQSDPDEYERPRDGATVTVTFTGRLEDGTVFDQQEDASLELDGEQAPEGLLLAIAKMKRGETAVVTATSPYGYGDAAFQAPKAAVPPASTLQYTITLKSISNPKNSWEMNASEKCEAATALKEKGNAAYSANKLGRACRFYKRAVELVEFDKDFSDAEKAVSAPVKRSCWLNLAAAQLKQGNWRDVVKNCDKVLAAEPANVKALYRKAQALMETQDYLEAEAEIKRGLDAEPTNAELTKLHTRLKALQKRQNKKEAAMYSKMFA